MEEDPNRPAGVPRSTDEYPSETSPDKDPAQELTQPSTSGDDESPIIQGGSPRTIRNRAEKQRRDNLNKSISQLGTILPAVLASNKKMDKTGILRLTAHFLRSHNHVFGDTFADNMRNFSDQATKILLRAMNGFFLTTTYKGIIVVVSDQVNKHLGYTEIELLGRHILNIVHMEDHDMLLQQLLPTSVNFGANGELLLPDVPDAVNIVNEMLANEHRTFIIRFIIQAGRSGPPLYQTCHVRGSFRKSDRACNTTGRCCNMSCRMRNRTEPFTSSGNDVVFIGFVQPLSETFIRERHLESFRMEYRTRHAIDGEILQSEHRISIVTGYMPNEVVGVNAMNFMHKDDVRWVIIALREMYDKHRLIGESCYRLMTKTGEFIFMRTRGQLEVEQSSGAVSTFVCLNTVVGEEEGVDLISKMKRKYSLMVGRRDCEQDTAVQEFDISMPAVEHPDNLKKVIIHLVSELPYGMINEEVGSERFGGVSVRRPLSIIPRQPEVIVNAIEKSYAVIPHRAPIQSYYAHNELTSGPCVVETNSANNYSHNSYFSQVYDRSYQNQANLMNYGFNSNNDVNFFDVPSTDIVQPPIWPIEIEDINSLDSNSVNETDYDERIEDWTPIQNDTDDSDESDDSDDSDDFDYSDDSDDSDEKSQLVEVNEHLLLANPLNLSYGPTEIVGPSDIIEPTSSSIEINNISQNSQNEMSTGINSHMEIIALLTSAPSSYNSTNDMTAIGTATNITEPTPGPSGTNHQNVFINSMTAISGSSDISQPISGPWGINNNQCNTYSDDAMTATGTLTDVFEPTPGTSGVYNQTYYTESAPGPSGIKRKKTSYNLPYDFSSEAHVSLSKRDHLLTEAQHIGKLRLSREGESSSTSMKRPNSSDGDDGNCKKFCDESLLIYDDGDVDYTREEYDTHVILEELYMNRRMQSALDNAINILEEVEPYVDDSWWIEAQLDMFPSLPENNDRQN